MAHLRSLLLCVLAGAPLNVGVSAAQTAAPAITPANRIVASIDDNQLVTLRGNTHPAANAKNDRGAVSPDLPMTDLILVLSRSPEQQAAFDAFVASLNDPNSPNYHQWLRPEQVGENYGPSLTDITTITNWLASHGFTVTQVTKDRMSIRFNGTVQKATNTFHTEIHNLAVNGAPHIGNMSDPQIPAALAPVVVGIKSLHNFFPRPLHHVGQPVIHDSQTGHWIRQPNPVAAGQSVSIESSDGRVPARAGGTVSPLFGITGTNSNGSKYQVEDIAPWDFATIYNVAPLWNSGIDGTGQTIAIAGTSAIDIGESSTAVTGANGNNDVATFRRFFNLPTNNSYNAPIQMSGNSQPLTVCTSTSSTATCGIGDLEENTLDVEWSGAVAKNAQIILVASYPASTTDDNLYDSESYIVDHLTAHIMNVSYGACELGLGTAGNVQYYNLWESAQAEGIAVFVATGDAGSASCDQNGDLTYNVPYPAEYGLSVNGLASTPFDTAVGGTDFNWCPLSSTDGCVSESASYWNTSNNLTTESNAKGYVAEVPWNDTCTNPLVVPFLEAQFTNTTYQASNGANYAITDAETGCNFITAYAQTLKNLGAGSYLNLVDTVGGGGGASGCVVNDGQNVSSCSKTTTSTGSSYGSITLYNDGWVKPSWQSGVTGIPSDGVRDLPDVSFFASDGFVSSSAYLICASAASACTYSISTEPTALEVGGTSVASPAMAGVMALINQKAGTPQGSPNAELYSLAAKQNYSGCSAERASTGNGCYFNDIDKGTNAMACDYSAFTQTPSPNCPVAHAGDYVGILPGYGATTGYDEATGLGSLNVANIVNSWVSEVGSGATTVTIAPSPTTITINQSMNVAVTVTGTGNSAPSGTVTLIGDGYSAALTIGTSPCTSNTNCTFSIPANRLAAGSNVTLTLYYSGDANYASNSKAATITVNVIASTVQVSAPASDNVVNAINVGITVSGPSGSTATATGTVYLKSGSYTSSAAALSGGSATISIPANSLAVGTDTITAYYSGDANYAGNTGTAQIAITQTATLTPSITVTPSPSSIDTGQTLGVTISVTGSGAAPTGTVTIKSGSYTSLAETIGMGPCASNTNCRFTIAANSLTAGTDTLTASYSGDANYASGSGSGTVTVTQSAYALSATTPSAVAPGSPTTSTISGAQSTTAYTGVVTLNSCTLTTYPSNASSVPSCAVTGTITFTAGTPSGTGTATIATTAASAELIRPRIGSGWFGAGAGSALAILVLLGIPARRRSWRRKWLSMLSILVALAVMGLMSSCGGGTKSTGGTGSPGTTAGSYTFTVQGTGNDPSGTKGTGTFTVTVN